jgi:hypothetical protein
MYSFRSSHYYLVFDFDCRGTSPFVQDIFGWSGEGMTDPKCVWVDTSADPPNRRLRKIYRISRDQVMRRQPITEADVVPNEVYARIQRTPAAAAAR